MTTHRTEHCHAADPRFQRGINLIEIMVAMTIGLFLVLGATTLYVNSKKSSDVDDDIALLQETARYAMSVIETDIRQANYWGLVKDAVLIENRMTSMTPIVDNTPCITNYAIDLENYLQGSNNGYTFDTGTTNSLCDPSPGAAATDADTLTVRRAATDSVGADNTRYQICSTRQSGSLVGDGICAAQVTDPVLGELHNLIVNTYYVDQESSIGDDTPSLRRKMLIAGNTWQDQELIPGIEDMQIQFGWDNSTGGIYTGQAVRYVNPDNIPTTVPPTGQIVSVRIWLLVRAEKQDGTFTDSNTYQYADRSEYTPNDSYRRLLVSRTIFIRNAMGT